MDIPLIDITFRIHDKLKSSQINDLENSLHTLDGVISARFPLHNAHMLMVELNPHYTDAEHLLQYITAHGFQAEVVVPAHM